MFAPPDRFALAQPPTAPRPTTFTRSFNSTYDAYHGHLGYYKLALSRVYRMLVYSCVRTRPDCVHSEHAGVSTVCFTGIHLRALLRVLRIETEAATRGFPRARCIMLLAGTADPVRTLLQHHSRANEVKGERSIRAICIENSQGTYAMAERACVGACWRSLDANLSRTRKCVFGLVAEVMCGIGARPSKPDEGQRVGKGPGRWNAGEEDARDVANEPGWPLNNSVYDDQTRS